jgi:hypothetical protein
MSDFQILRKSYLPPNDKSLTKCYKIYFSQSTYFLFNLFTIIVLIFYTVKDFNIKTIANSRINPVPRTNLNNAVRYKCNIDGKAIELFNEAKEWWILI